MSVNQLDVSVCRNSFNHSLVTAVTSVCAAVEQQQQQQQTKLLASLAETRTSGQENATANSCQFRSQMLTDNRNSFTVALSRKFKTYACSFYARKQLLFSARLSHRNSVGT